MAIFKRKDRVRWVEVVQQRGVIGFSQRCGRITLMRRNNAVIRDDLSGREVLVPVYKLRFEKDSGGSVSGLFAGRSMAAAV